MKDRVSACALSKKHWHFPLAIAPDAEDGTLWSNGDRASSGDPLG